MHKIYIVLIKWFTNKLGFKKDILKREYPKPPQPLAMKPLTPEQLKELGIHINVDVTDCKNYKEASMVQDLILNKKVKINIFQNNKVK